MGGAARRAGAAAARPAASRGSTPIRVRARPRQPADGRELVAHEGEIIGLAGLAGHGQTRLLLDVFEGASRRRPGVTVDGPVALVAGDRQSDGIFPLWSIARNIGIRTPDLDNNILSLSGGNQQKALFARALGSDARLVLMDDPMRGVDDGTKLEVYDLIREEAGKGRTFLWYTTETDELGYCDHVYVFRNGRIVADLDRSEVSEEQVIQSSFAEAAT
jgi:ribose transport system ATP-binding protein